LTKYVGYLINKTINKNGEFTERAKKDVIYLMSIRPEPSAKVVTELGNS
jgi:hypothetical protein